MAEVARVQPVLSGAIVAAVVGLIVSAAQPTVLLGDTFPNLVPADTPGFEGLMKTRLLGFSVGGVLTAPFTSLLSALMITAVYYGVARLLKGKAAFGALFACVCFSYGPTLLLPLGLLAAPLRPAQALLVYVGLGVVATTWALGIVYQGIRETFWFSRKRALAVFVIPHGICISLLVLLTVALVALAAALATA